MKLRLKKIGKWLLFLTPLCLGTAGFCRMGGITFWDALFRSICMYALNYQDTPPNLLVEAARWTAPLATAGGVLMAAGRLRKRLRDYLSYLRGNSVAVYGPGAPRAELLAQLPALGMRGIDAGDSWAPVRGNSYLLLGSEEENFAFYNNNREMLSSHTVYLQTAALPAQSVSSPNLRLFSPEETAARLFWKEHCFYETSQQNAHQTRIVFLGFGVLGEKLLTYALLNNIFDSKQHIEYHIFGDTSPFTATHTSLPAIQDTVVTHPEPWYDALPLLETAQMVVVLSQAGQLALLQSLLLATTETVFHVFDAGESGIALLSGQERLLTFPWEQKAREPAHIFTDAMFQQAQKINLRYAHLYRGVEETPQALREEWVKLDGFTRYSNVSAADYHEIRLYMLSAMGLSKEQVPLHPHLLESLAELEHIRWCRYHYLNNWRYGIPQNGQRKDPKGRIHSDLIPYGELTEEEKQKDRDNVLLLLSIS